MRNRAEIQADIFRHILSGIANCSNIHDIVEGILAIPEIAIVDRQAEIPNPDPHSYEGEWEAIIATKTAAHANGWLKEVRV